MDCNKLEKIEAFHDGMLDEAASKIIEKHLDQCPVCRERLAMAEIKDREIRKLRMVQPALKNRIAFRNEVLAKINTLERQPQFRAGEMLDLFRNFLLQPAMRFGFAVAAIFIAGLFFYQHYVLVSKIEFLADKLEANQIIAAPRPIDRLDILSKFQQREPVSGAETEQLFRAFSDLQLKYGLLVKAIKIKHPEVYEELKQLIEETAETSTTQKEETYEIL